MSYTFREFNKCCSEDGSKLTYPRFSVVFLQTFCIHDSLQFTVPETSVLKPEQYRAVMQEINNEAQNLAVSAAKAKGSTTIDEGWRFKSLAEYLDQPISYMYQDIEKQIFITSEDDDKELKCLRHKHPCTRAGREQKSVVPYKDRNEDKVYTFSNSSVYRFSLKGFDFTVPISSGKDEDGNYKHQPVKLKGHANVEMSLFYGNTASIAYKFFFDGYTASVLNEDTGEQTVAVTDDLIAFLSCHLGAEYWSSKNKEESSIDFFKKFNVDKIWLDKDGKALPNDTPESILWPDQGTECVYHNNRKCHFNKDDGNEMCAKIEVLNTTSNEKCPFNGEKRVFNNVMLRYKKYLYENCTAYKEKCTRREKKEHRKFRMTHPLSVSFDHHYAMVDIWGDVKHESMKTRRDVFAENDVFHLSEPDIVTHIREYHKPEMIGLMTLYPSEWPYRDAGTFDYVCGESVAIDTDDLVMVGTHMAVVIGTYDRRGEESCGNNWKEMAKVKARHQVAWPEYLMILQFILAKKTVISRMKDRIIEITKKIADRSNEKLLYENANFSLDLTRQILQLDVVKYAKFASHRVMYDRTMERMKVDKDIEEIHDMSEMLNSNLQNMSNYKSMRTDSGLNWVLALISIVSVSELLFQDARFDFWHTLFGKEGTSVEVTSIPAAIVISLIALAGIAALVTLGVTLFIKWNNERK